MSLYNGPPRPGARGGRDQFSWDNVKADKDREYYLGHSVKALAGRWQKGRDVYWYTREKAAQDTLQDEVQAVKQREEELMMEALGLKPKTVVKPAPQLNKHDLDELIKGKQDEEEQPDEAGAAAQEADRIKGLGYIAGTGGGPAEAVHTTLPGVGPAGPGGQRLPPPPPLPGAAAVLAGGRPGAAVALASGMTAAQLKEQRTAEKRARKEAKREAKKAKKEAKRAKKEAKKARRDGEGAKEQKQAGERKSRRRRSASGSSSSSSDGSSSDSDEGGRRPPGRAPEPDGAAGGRHRPDAMRPEGPSVRAPHQMARGYEWDRDRERDRGWDRDMERGRGYGGPVHERAEPSRGAGRHGDGADDEYGRQPRGRARHDSPSPSPRPRRGASPFPAGRQQQQPQRHHRHDSPSPGRGRRHSRSRSPVGRRRPEPEPRTGQRAERAAWGRQVPYGEDAAREDSRDGRERSGAVGGNTAGRSWKGQGDRARSRSPRGGRHDSRGPVPRRREDRSRSPGDTRGSRPDDGRGGTAGAGDARERDGEEAARDRQRERRQDSRSRSPDRGRIRGR